MVGSAIVMAGADRVQPVEAACGCLSIATTQPYVPVASNGDFREAAELGIHYH